MKIVRSAVALAVAVVVLLLGLTLLAHNRPAVGTVYDKDFRGPKITIDGGPHLERAPQFRVLVGPSRKQARWVRVNPVQYAGCAEGNRWNGVLCSKFNLHLPAMTLNNRHVALLAIAAAMVVVPAAAAATSGQRHD